MEHFKIENLSFTYPLKQEKAVKSLSLDINKGEYIAICGRSGCGKTTLLKLLKPILTAHGKTEGDILFNKENLFTLPLCDQVSKIGFVMQNPDSQIVTDKVWHELAFGLENLGVDQKTIRIRVAEMANYFGIDTWFHKNVSELSGGQKQLLNLASVMAMQPEVLILDEPTSQLDPIASADFLNTIKKINEELGTTVIITEHRLENVFALADRVIVMEKGEIIANDIPENIGRILKDLNNEMFASLPTPVQVFYGINVDGKCPLTVRDGRNWLSEIFMNNDLKYTSLEENNEKIFNQKPILEIKDAYFRYEKDSPDILNGLSLQVKKASMLAIMGGNGTGKSTMLKAICGLNKIYGGKILIDGKSIKKMTDSMLFTNNLTMLPQDPTSLFMFKTVIEDLQDMTDNSKEIQRVVEICEISDLLESHPFDLSGGEIQRAALAKVLLTNPKILLLDEPTKGIDNFFKDKLAEILKQLQENEVTIILVSHDVEFCAKYADEVAMFFDGDIITVNTPNKFFSLNNFYTTAANRMSRHIFQNTVVTNEVINLCQKNIQ